MRHIGQLLLKDLETNCLAYSYTCGIDHSPAFKPLFTACAVLIGLTILAWVLNRRKATKTFRLAFFVLLGLSVIAILLVVLNQLSWIGYLG